jgi:dephospho-CoA kinase
MFQVGVTGGIGSGKSLICKIFTILGIPVYEADSRAKRILNDNLQLREEIKSAFGEQAYINNQLNRSYLAAEVFNDGNKISLLNSLVHPKVAQDYVLWVQMHKTAPYVIKEAALLFETGSYQSLDKVITVYTPLHLRIERILQRDPQRSQQEVNAIIDKQISDEEKIQRADFVIYNDENQLVIPQVLSIHNQLRNNLSI